MKNKMHNIEISTGAKRIVMLLMLINALTNGEKVLAQCGTSIGAQSVAFGKPYDNAAFVAPAILGDSTICTGQSTTLSVDTGYSSYSWSSGSTSNTATVGAGTHSVVVGNAAGCTRTTSINITEVPCTLALNLQCFIQGYYAGGGLMNSVLMNQGMGSDPLVADSIEVGLRNQNAPYSQVAIALVVLHTNGIATVNFQVSAGTYYITVRHRNGLYTWSSTPLTFGAQPVNFNLTTSQVQAYGGNLLEVEAGVWAIYAGDFNADENIDLLDANILETGINNFEFGYKAEDLNGDGNVDLLDSPVLEGNISNFIFSGHP